MNAMKTEQALTDKVAIGLSLMCAIHCLAIPLLLLYELSILTVKFTEKKDKDVEDA